MIKNIKRIVEVTTKIAEVAGLVKSKNEELKQCEEKSSENFDTIHELRRELEATYGFGYKSIRELPEESRTAYKKWIEDNIEDVNLARALEVYCELEYVDLEIWRKEKSLKKNIRVLEKEYKQLVQELNELN